MNRMIAITIRPGAATAVARLIAPLLFAMTTAPPAPTSTRKKVPSNSENSRLHSRLTSSKSSIPGYSSASSALRVETGCAAGWLFMDSPRWLGASSLPPMAAPLVIRSG